MPLDMRSLMSKTSRESTATALKPKPSASGTIAAGYPSTPAPARRPTLVSHATWESLWPVRDRRASPPKSSASLSDRIACRKEIVEPVQSSLSKDLAVAAPIYR
jgi:hypothetical protein